MYKGTDSEYLKKNQYQDSGNLNARAELHRRFSTNPQDWHRWVFDQFDLPNNARILELGAGPGWLWINNRDRVPSDWQITLSDMSEGMVAEQQNNLDGLSGQFDHRVIDAQKIPFEDDTFDAVIANHMLYHVPDLDQAITEIYRVLKLGGRLYAATNGNDHMIEIWQFIHQIAPDQIKEQRDMVFHRNFRLEDGDDSLKTAFNTVDKRLYDSNLRVTEAEPLVDYLCSGWAMEVGCPEELKQMGREFFRQMIDKDGAIHITKSSGLFIASKTQ